MTAINVISMSNAADLGYRALADVAAASEGIPVTDYRIVGGHMVQMLIHAYPTPGATERSTADADAGIREAVAAGQNLHNQLLERGYETTNGNHYIRTNEDGALIEVDLLIPHHGIGRPMRRPTEVNGRGFDAIPGLGFALNATPLLVDVKVLLRGDKEDLVFTVPVPDVEAALILKSLAWKSRTADKDLADISSLLEIVQLHKDSLTNWGYSDERLAAKGQRLDAARVLHQLVDLSGRGRIKPLNGLSSPARLAALIREHIPAPPK
ncbi:hypothetical protein ASF98_18720 [Arthrobacter sp. Leaf337]|uniref:hypothetical protein n=1 Tax=Arthrobacter sp. Leaf337 TaxID=1736342 RepID=UPI0006FF9170|nr:hypothetical protein [Arthrobacter sp. Leaf337]KQR80329.1 hypothetical protein ASF98_18720 [Arthrobacter sp. Leaf337]